MIVQKDCDSWLDFENQVHDLAETRARPAGDDFGHYSPLLYRGHADSGWELETTLERARPSSTLLSEYYRSAAAAKTQIETFTERRWDDFNPFEVKKLFDNYDTPHFTKLPAYDFLIYLRHHGFPSPLLDWTRSIYVAAYFAFQKIVAERVAIFAYQEYAGSGKLGSSNSPQIRTLGPYIRTHPRHFLQQGEYTLCWQFADGSWHIAPHSTIFDTNNENQDRLWKFTIPSTECATALKRLDEYNINAFSLFQSEESLIATIARKLIH